MMHHILLLEPLSESSTRKLEKSQGCVVISPEDSYNFSSINGVITRGKGVVDSAFLDKHQNISVIARCGVGLDNIAVEDASVRGITVINTPGLNAQTVAEHTMGLMLMAQRKLKQLDAEVHIGNWAYRASYEGAELFGKTLGILGMGNIGNRVAKMAAAFGMEVRFWNRNKRKSPYTQVDFEEILAISDILTIHLPFNKATDRLLDRKAFLKMKKGVVIVNTARGAIISESDMIECLRNGRIKGYATDVLESQPPREDHPFFHMDNVIITPHAASLTQETFENICHTTVNHVLSILRKEKIENRFIVNHPYL